MTTPITVPTDAGLLTDIVSFGTITPLNLGATSSSSATLTTANKIVSGINPLLGSSSKSVIGTTATGWGELYSQGNAGAWASAGSAGAPSGHGFLYDSTALEGQTIIGGSWQFSARIQASAGSAIGVLLIRAYVYNSGTYTQIGTITYASATYGTGTADSLGAATFSNQGFSVGDKLYVDFWFNVTTNTLSTSTDGLKISGLTTSLNPGSSHTAVITPGFVPTSLTLAASDTGSGTDSPVISATLATNDAGVLADAASLLIGVASNDVGGASDSPTLGTITPTTSDAGALSDASSLLIGVAAPDAATLNDVPAFPATMAVGVNEAGAGGDVLTDFQQFSVAPDSATLTDSVRQAPSPRNVTFITGP